MLLLKLISIRAPTSNTTYLATDASDWRRASCSTDTTQVVFIALTFLIEDVSGVWLHTNRCDYIYDIFLNYYRFQYVNVLVSGIRLCAS